MIGALTQKPILDDTSTWLPHLDVDPWMKTMMTEAWKIHVPMVATGRYSDY